MTELHGVSGVEQMQPADVTAAKNPAWIYHATDARMGLLIAMHNEWECVVHTIERVRERFAWIGIVRSYTPTTFVQMGDETPEEIPVPAGPFGFLEQNGVEVEFAATLPDLGNQFSKWELPAQSLCRNYSALFSAVRDVPGIDYCVAITGDTVLLHPYGIEEIVAAMEKKGAILGCSKACGQEFHRADLTLEELEAGQGGGRKQGLDVPDHMPQLFVVKQEAVQRGAYRDIEVVNRWTSEHNLGESLRKDCPESWKKLTHVFSETAYGWFDGVIFNAVTGHPGGDA